MIIEAPLYTFRRVRYDWYEVSKWDYESTAPEDTYSILLTGSHRGCSCNSPQRPCKHFRMLERVMDREDLPWVAIDSLGRIWENVDI